MASTKAKVATGTVSLATLIAAWTAYQQVDEFIFFEAEAAEVQEIVYRQWYLDRLDIATLKRLHELEPSRQAALDAEIEFYRRKLLELDAGE